VSREREAGEKPSLHSIWSTVKSRSEIGWMAFVTLFIFVIWMYQVRLLIALLIGSTPRSRACTNSSRWC